VSYRDIHDTLVAQTQLLVACSPAASSKPRNAPASINAVQFSQVSACIANTSYAAKLNQQATAGQKILHLCTAVAAWWLCSKCRMQSHLGY
jgi:biotin synthase-related radical SAM superfamily protein